ncbi:MAG: hypothetical protein SF051_16385 [Elusimicrobiota bacterium]|nr:hypothetical protein [Elusimicrobiota bacterium]
MTVIIRLMAAGGLVYAAFAVAYPDWVGSVYPAMTLSLVAGGAVGAWFLRRILDLGDGRAALGLELGVVLAVFLWVGFTMPQKSGKAPFTQWAEGARPRRDDARRGLARLGVDPGGAAAGLVLALFPR